MNPTQADAYNKCMTTHWSSLPDSIIFGVAGYEYHQNVVLSCQQVALATQAAAAASTDQPTQPAKLSEPAVSAPSRSPAQSN
jgi:hypothetical protein